MADELRCFWMTLTGKTPPGVPRRVFVALCDGANVTGDPNDCTCESLRTKVADLEAKLRAERVRAATAEQAEARFRKLRKTERDALARARARLISAPRHVAIREPTTPVEDW